MDSCTLSVVIPARDEEGRVGGAVAAVDDILAAAGVSHEIIVVDDGSVDATAAEAEEAGRSLRGAPVVVLAHAQHRGKGAALATGMAASMGHWVAMIDADLEFPPETLPLMLALAAKDGSDRVCAAAQRSRDERSRWERLTSRAARRVASSVLAVGVEDVQAGLKVFPGWFARTVLTEVREQGWMWDAEALLLARQHGLRIVGTAVSQRRVRRRRAGLRQMAAAAISLARVIGRHGEAGRVVRFAVVGSINTAVDILLFTVLVVLAPPRHDALIAAAYTLTAWVAAACVGYVLHGAYTFRVRLPIAAFYAVSVANVLIQIALTSATTALAGTRGALAGRAIGLLAGGTVAYLGYRALAVRAAGGKPAQLPQCGTAGALPERPPRRQ